MRSSASPFASRSSRQTTAQSSRRPSTGLVLDKGIGHFYIKPMRPRHNHKVERSHRIDTEEFYRLLDGVVIDDAKLFHEKLQEWEHFYSYARPHGALAGQTPYERLRQKTTLDVSHPRQSHTRLHKANFAAQSLFDPITTSLLVVY